MNKFTTLLASALLVTTAFANAADMSGTYAVVEGGYAMPTGKDKILNSVVADTNKVYTTKLADSKKKPGVAVLGLGAGYKFDQNMRSDFTLNYLTNSTVKYSASQDVAANKYSLSAKAKLTVFSAMINGYYDITALSEMFTPYVGAGIGFSVINYKISGQRSTDNVKDRDYSGKIAGRTFAYQVGAGTLVKISDGVDFKIGYRFVDNGKAKVKSLSGAAITEHNFRTHQIVAGLQFAL
jgi:opacity protein-like surface antigen